MKCRCGEEMVPLNEFGVKYVCPECGRVAISYTDVLLVPFLYMMLFGLAVIIALATRWENDREAAQKR